MSLTVLCHACRRRPATRRGVGELLEVLCPECLRERHPEEAMPETNLAAVRARNEARKALMVTVAPPLARVGTPTHCLQQAVRDVDALLAANADLERKVRGYQVEYSEVDQALGKALGYPLLGPEAGGDGTTICTGEHTPVTLAMEAARRLRKRQAALNDLLHIGDLMANVCSNTAQDSWTVTDQDRENMRALYREWDRLRTQLAKET